MPTFRYEVADTKGRVVSGTMDGETSREIVDRLKEQGYVVRAIGRADQVLQAAPPQQHPSPPVSSSLEPPISTRPATPPVVQRQVTPRKEEPLQRTTVSPRRPEEPARPAPAQAAPQRVKGWMSERDLYFFFAQLASLLRAGVGPVQALNGLATRVRQPVLRQAAQEMEAAASRGGSMSEVMARYEAFPSHAVGGIRSGELSGFLPEAAEELANQLNSSVAFRRHFWVTRVCGWNLVLTVLFMIPVMPAFWGAFQAHLTSTSETLRFMLAEYLRYFMGRALPIGLLLFTGYYLGKTLLWAPKRLLLRHGMWLRIPTIGARAAQESMRVFCTTLRNNYAAALPPEAAWNAAAEAVPNAVYRERFLRAGKVIREGANVDQAAVASGLFTPEQCSLLQTGQQAGDMVGMLEHLSKLSAYEFELVQGKAKWSIWWLGIILLTLAVGVGMIWWAQGYFGSVFTEVDKWMAN